MIMKKSEKSLARGLLLAACALSAGLFTACSQDAETDVPASGGTDVEVTATVSDMVGALTRTASGGLNTAETGFSAFSTSGASTDVAVKVDNGSGTYGDAYTYTLTGAKAISAPTPKPQFPGTVTSVSVYGWYPANSGSQTFTVSTDQTTDLNYLASDILVAQPQTCSRAKSGSNWNVTAANLTFQHVMSKVGFTVTPGTGVTLKKIEIVSAYPTVTLSQSGSTVTAAGSGTTTDIKLWDDTSTSVVTTYGVFAPKTYSSATFLKVTAEVGGVEGVVNYTVNGTFEAGKVYTASLNVNATDVETGTVTLSDWTGGDAPSLELGN